MRSLIIALLIVGLATSVAWSQDPNADLVITDVGWRVISERLAVLQGRIKNFNADHAYDTTIFIRLVDRTGAVVHQSLVKIGDLASGDERSFEANFSTRAPRDIRMGLIRLQLKPRAI